MSTAIPLNKAIPYIENNIILQMDMIKKKQSCPIVYISGSPGIGKSDLLAQIAINLKYALNVQYIGTMLIEQFGLPLATTNESAMFQRWSYPELFNTENMRLDSRDNFDDPVILALDDIHLASKTIQTYLFQLLTYRSIHNKKMPDNFVMICAGNRSTDKAGFQAIMAPIANRFDFIEVVGEASDWLTNYAIPNNLRSDIITFIEHHPDALNSTPLESAAWPSSRSWTYTSYCLDNYEKLHGNKLSVEELKMLVEGKVGIDAATKFIEYRMLFHKWDAKSILSDPTNNPLPIIQMMDKINCYACGSAIVSQFIANARSENFELTQKLIKQLNIVKILISEIAKQSKELVPLFLRSLIINEAKANNKMQIITNMLSDKYLLECIQELLKSVNLKVV